MGWACDDDEDGYDAEVCGGTDCDDEDEGVSPEAVEIWYDGEDRDCDDWSDDDQDYDGYDAEGETRRRPPGPGPSWRSTAGSDVGAPRRLR